MCGIVGMVGTRAVRDSVMSGLQRLEYRGYDSFGITVSCHGVLTTKRSVGSVSQKVAKGFLSDVPEGQCAIAHTRWATHGGITEANAHPHVSHDGAWSVVHNGVIQNWRELRTQLETDGIRFLSETDTEVIPHLFAQEYERCGDVQRALVATIGKLEGEYAIACITTHAPDRIFATRRKSPLCFGLKNGEAMLASDQSALVSLTREVTFLSDGDVLELWCDDAHVFEVTPQGLKPVVRSSTLLEVAEGDAGLMGYPHYMLKEIYEVPLAVRSALALDQAEIDAVVQECRERQVTLTGAGSAYYAALMGQHAFADMGKTYVRTHPSDELLSLVQCAADDHIVVVSQSGETYDTLEVMRAAARAGSGITAITNVYASSISRAADRTLLQRAGREVCVLSTKSVVSQALVLMRLARSFGVASGRLSRPDAQALDAALTLLPDTSESLIKTLAPQIQRIAKGCSHIHDWFFIGRGRHYPVALESALKLKEVTYAHAEGMPAGFLKHGTISLIDESVMTVVFVPRREIDTELYELTLSNVSEIRARGGRVILVGHDLANAEGLGAEHVVSLPSLHVWVDPILELLVGQLLAYYVALQLGRPIDQPRSLAKAVTVR